MFFKDDFGITFVPVVAQSVKWLTVGWMTRVHFPARAESLSPPLSPDWLWGPLNLLCSGY